MENELHVVFGSGQVGHPLAQKLLEAGKRVRVVKRSQGDVPEGAEVMLGDASKESFSMRHASVRAWSITA